MIKSFESIQNTGLTDYFVITIANLINAHTFISTHQTLYGPFTSLHFCKFGNFRKNFIFANSVKRYICNENSVLVHDLPTSIEDRVYKPFCQSFSFTKLRSCEVSRK